jgi:hypothetical protein
MFARSRALRNVVNSTRTYATSVADSAGVKVAGVDLGQPTTSISVVVKAGSRYETLPGVAHALKNFAFKVSCEFARGEVGVGGVGLGAITKSAWSVGKYGALVQPECGRFMTVKGRSRSRDMYLAAQRDIKDTKPEDKPSSLSQPICLQLLIQNNSHSNIQHTDPDNLLTSLETMMIGHLERLVPQDCP